MTFSYSEKFYEEMETTSVTSAEVIVPIVMDLVSPKSVIDVGCAEGRWLSVFSKAGAKIFGIDGSWVKPERLVIPKEQFQSVNLEKPFRVDRSADLAMTLEVAEHLPDSSADGFIESLVKLAPVILFSAAIPMQGGSHHINEQWPDYWARKFSKHGYIPADCVRRRIWDDKRVSFFYAQNIFIYAKESELKKYPKLQAEIYAGNDRTLSLVHPYLYEYYAKRWRMLVPFLGKLPISFLKKIKNILQKFSRKSG
jgi:SAM-dependent methyltransferase